MHIDSADNKLCSQSFFIENMCIILLMYLDIYLRKAIALTWKIESLKL